ncbi:MAG: hypothetical protein ABR985_22485 [Methanotrichaceae archaeon]
MPSPGSLLSSNFSVDEPRAAKYIHIPVDMHYRWDVAHLHPEPTVAWTRLCFVRVHNYGAANGREISLFQRILLCRRQLCLSEFSCVAKRLGGKWTFYDIIFGR